ncbi:MAG: sensor histidine kinase [Spirochaetota bacterium]
MTTRNDDGGLLRHMETAAVLFLAGLFVLRSIVASMALANALSVMLLNAVLAISVASGPLIRSVRPSDRASAWVRRAGALAVVASMATEGQLLYPIFLSLDVASASLLATGVLALVLAASLTFRLDAPSQVAGAVGAIAAAGALCDAASDSVLLSWLLPMAVSATMLLSVRLLYRLQQIQREALETERQRAALSEKLALASAQILDSRNRESLSMIASGIAHEINNPLTYIRGNVELLTEVLKEADGQVHELLDSVVAGVEAVGDVVSRVRSIFRGVLEPSQPVNLHETVRIAILSLARSQSPRVSIANEVDRSVVADAHPADVYIVTTNLLKNAVEASSHRADGRIVVAADSADSYITITVRDNGAGMTEEQTSRCFDPFFTTKSEGGMGVGLALCRAIADRNGDELAIASAPGEGTTASYRMNRSRCDNTER